MNYRTRFATLALAFCLLVPTITLASPSADRDQLWWSNLNQQLNTSMDSPVEAILTQTMQHIVFFGTYHRDKVNFNPTVPKLLYLYEYHSDEAMRTLALAALHAVGDEIAMERLMFLVEDEPSERLRMLTRRALSDYQKQKTPNFI